MKETEKKKTQSTKTSIKKDKAETVKKTTPKKSTTTSKKVVKGSGNQGKIIGAVIGVFVILCVSIALIVYFNRDTEARGIISDRYIVVPYTGGGIEDPAVKMNSSNDYGTSLRKNMATGATEIDDQTTVKKAAKLRQWYSDGYTYYQFYVGHIKNVPIAWEIPAYYDGNELNISFSTSTCTEEVVEQSLATCEEITTSSSNSVSTGVSVTVSSDFGLVGTEVAASVGWEGSWSQASALSTSKTYTTARSFTESTTYGLNYLITGQKTGYYRYTLFATTDVYAFARTTNGTSFEVSYEYSARTSTYAYGVDYSTDNNFNKSTSEDKLELSAEECRGLSLSSKPVEEVIALNKPFVTSYEYDSDGTAVEKRPVIKSSGEFGMATPYSSSDKLDMSSLEAYRKDTYVFEFAFTLRVTEDYDGYQEFYLYNSFSENDVTTKDITQSEAYNTYGLVGEAREIDTDSSNNNHKITFRLPGNVVKPTMYTKFGAHGVDRDDWNVSNVKCTVTVYRASPQVINTTEKRINDNLGRYAAKDPGNASAISLSEFSDYLNGSNTFTFTFAVRMKEYNDGFQEMFIYKNNNYSGPDDDLETVKKNGLVAAVTGTLESPSYDYGAELFGNGGDETYSTVYFTLTISGSDLARTVYLRYGADGGSHDDWYVENVKVLIYVKAN